MEGMIPKGLSQDGVSGETFDILDGERKRDQGKEKTELLSFSPDSEHVYHAYRSASPRCGDTFYCRITVDIWSTTEQKHLVRILVDKQVSDIKSFRRRVNGNLMFNVCFPGHRKDGIPHRSQTFQHASRVSDCYVLQPSYPVHFP
jgi:hypothetical protein